MYCLRSSPFRLCVCNARTRSTPRILRNASRSPEYFHRNTTSPRSSFDGHAPSYGWSTKLDPRVSGDTTQPVKTVCVVIRLFHEVAGEQTPIRSVLRHKDILYSLELDTIISPASTGLRALVRVSKFDIQA